MEEAVTLLWRCALIITVTAADNSCSRIPWNDTICCTAGRPRQQGEVRSGAENTLSVLGCEARPHHSYVANITLLWNYNDMPTIEGYSLERLYIFSMCSNPSSYPEVQSSVNTILYDSNRHHHTSSTTVSQPPDSTCSYFGCYGAFYGFYYYPFSEVSCRVHSDAPTMTHSTKLHSTVQESRVSTQAYFSQQLKLSPYTADQYLYTAAAQSPQLSSMETLNAPTMTHSTKLHSTVQESRVLTQAYFSQQLKLSPYTADQYLYTAAAQSPQLSSMETLNGFWLYVWYILLLLAVILTVCGNILCLLITRHCTARANNRNPRTDFNGGDWPSQLWTHEMYIEEEIRDKLSLHSVHTMYEELVQTSNFGSQMDS